MKIIVIFGCWFRQFYRGITFGRELSFRVEPRRSATQVRSQM